MDERYRQADGVAARTVAGEDVLVPLRGPTKRVFTLNRTGKVLWDGLAEGAGVLELEALLVERCGVSGKQVHADVAHFLSDMRRFCLIEVEVD